MALEDVRSEMQMCMRCSACKFIPAEKIKGYDHANVCPSISRFNFHGYSGGGRMGIGMSLLNKRIENFDKLSEVVYNCQACGACDVSCKYGMDMDVLNPIYEMRAYCVENGYTVPALDKLVASMRNGGPMLLGTQAKRGAWCEGLDVKDYTKEKVKVIYHAGCLTAGRKDLWKTAQGTIALLKKAGVDVGVAKENEPCCGGRAYQTGYQKDALNQAKSNAALFKKSGAEILVTGCADCYHAFKVLFEKFGLKSNIKVLHTSEYLAMLLKEGKLKPRKAAASKVTYHDPCHLGRLGEPYVAWKGVQRDKFMRVYDPPKTYMRGTGGIYEPPRDVIKSIPGVQLVEMDRIKEYAWCCGAGGGVKESNPEFAKWTAVERIKEAESTGADALVTACPHCVDNFKDAVKGCGSEIKIYDIVELLEKSI
jgi:Fe-S oxidoreductase